MTEPEKGSTSTKPVRQYSVLFVCLGNICRSTMAEGTFRHLTHFDKPQAHPLIKHVDSCGTGAYHAGDSPDPRTMDVLKRHKITDYVHAARRVRVPEDFQRFDYVLAMDESNLLDLRDMANRAVKKGSLTKEEGVEAMKRIRLYGEFGGKSEAEEIDDPWYGGRSGFDVAYEQVTRFGKGLLKDIEEKSMEEAEP